MKIAIILNGISRKKKEFYHRIHPAIAEEFNTTILETRFAGHAEELASEAVLEKYNVVMAAGGDGTVHQVLNGLLKNEAADRPVLGIIPLGTGNDFARSCAVKPDGTQITSLLRVMQPRLRMSVRSSVSVKAVSCEYAISLTYAVLAWGRK